MPVNWDFLHCPSYGFPIDLFPNALHQFLPLDLVVLSLLAIDMLTYCVVEVFLNPSASQITYALAPWNV